MGIDPTEFNALVEGKTVNLLILKNTNGLEVTVTNFGAKIVSVLAPDKNNIFADIVLGFDNLDDYLTSKNPYIGSPIGRYANRINNGTFQLNGTKYTLTLNEGSNHLNGGEKGLHSVVWDVILNDSSSVKLSYICRDKEEGYPGNLYVTLSYTLTENNELVISYNAETDKPTPVNLTHCLLFNLEGAGYPTINKHVLRLNANFYTPTNDALIPTGEISPIIGTPLDFTTPTEIAKKINADFKPLQQNNGYDHHYVLNTNNDSGMIFAASVYAPESGRFMEVFTNEPSIHFYSGNSINPAIKGKKKQVYKYRSAFRLSPQQFSDSPNKPNFPNTILHPGEQYSQTSIYKFSVR